MEPQKKVINQTVTIPAPGITEVAVEFTDLDKPTELIGEDGVTKIMAQTLVRLVDRRGGEEKVLYTSAFDEKLSLEKKRELVTRYAKMIAKKEVPAKVLAKREQNKRVLVSMEEYRKKRRKEQKAARKKNRR
jgi:hypothetical protein